MRKQNDIEKKFSLKEVEKILSMIGDYSLGDISLRLVRDCMIFRWRHSDIVEMNLIPWDIYIGLIKMSCPVTICEGNDDEYYLEYSSEYSWRRGLSELMDKESLEIDDDEIKIWFNKETNEKLALVLSKERLDVLAESQIRSIRDGIKVISIQDNYTGGKKEYVLNKIDESQKDKLINKLLDFYYGNSEEVGGMIFGQHSIILCLENYSIEVISI